MKARSLLMIFCIITPLSLNALVKEGMYFIAFQIVSGYISSLVNDREQAQEQVDKQHYKVLKDSPDDSFRIRISSELIKQIDQQK